MVKVWPYDTIEIQYREQRFKVNGQRLKEYNDGALNTLKIVVTLNDLNSKFFFFLF